MNKNVTLFISVSRVEPWIVCNLAHLKHWSVFILEWQELLHFSITHLSCLVNSFEKGRKANWIPSLEADLNLRLHQIQILFVTSCWPLQKRKTASLHRTAAHLLVPLKPDTVRSLSELRQHHPTQTQCCNEAWVMDDSGRWWSGAPRPTCWLLSPASLWPEANNLFSTSTPPSVSHSKHTYNDKHTHTQNSVFHLNRPHMLLIDVHFQALSSWWTEPYCACVIL